MPNTQSKLSSSDCSDIGTICAVEILGLQHGSAQLGGVSQIVPKADLVTCGPGFNESTVRVRLGHKFYFVFRVDLERASACGEPEKEPSYISTDFGDGTEATDNTGQIIGSELAKRSREPLSVKSELSFL